jgi:hypothetical protein
LDVDDTHTIIAQTHQGANYYAQMTHAIHELYYNYNYQYLIKELTSLKKGNYFLARNLNPTVKLT